MFIPAVMSLIPGTPGMLVGVEEFVKVIVGKVFAVWLVLHSPPPPPVSATLFNNSPSSESTACASFSPFQKLHLLVYLQFGVSSHFKKLKRPAIKSRTLNAPPTISPTAPIAPPIVLNAASIAPVTSDIIPPIRLPTMFSAAHMGATTKPAAPLTISSKKPLAKLSKPWIILLNTHPKPPADSFLIVANTCLRFGGIN